MPVEAQSHSGVSRVISGSRMTTRGTSSGWPAPSFRRAPSSVVPNTPVCSPAERVVGIAIWGTGRLTRKGSLSARRCGVAYRFKPASSRISSARQRAAPLAVSMGLPPPTLTRPSAWAARAWAAASRIVRFGTCWLASPYTPAQRSPRSPWTRETHSVFVASVRPVMMKARFTPSRSTAWGSSLREPAPKMTRSTGRWTNVWVMSGLQEGSDRLQEGLGLIAGDRVAGVGDLDQAALRENLEHALGDVRGEHIGFDAPDDQRGAGDAREVGPEVRHVPASLPRLDPQGFVVLPPEPPAGQAVEAVLDPVADQGVRVGGRGGGAGARR